MQYSRTPYHQLGSAGHPRIPAWAERRSVYRSAGRTLYLVETSKLDEARSDLESLQRGGWHVRITPPVSTSSATASVALVREAA